MNKPIYRQKSHVLRLVSIFHNIFYIVYLVLIDYDLTLLQLLSKVLFYILYCGQAHSKARIHCSVTEELLCKVTVTKTLWAKVTEQKNVCACVCMNMCDDVDCDVHWQECSGLYVGPRYKTTKERTRWKRGEAPLFLALFVCALITRVWFREKFLTQLHSS